MSRSQSDIMRQLRAEERRSPVDNAFHAFLALDKYGRASVVARWRDFHKDREATSPKLMIVEPEVAP